MSTTNKDLVRRNFPHVPVGEGDVRLGWEVTSHRQPNRRHEHESRSTYLQALALAADIIDSGGVVISVHPLDWTVPH